MKILYTILLTAIAGVTFSQTKIKVACIGNSITAGATPTLNYPLILSGYMGFNYKVYNVGKSSTTLRFSPTMAWIKQPELVDSIKKIKPDMVTIKLGTNDAGAGAGIRAEYKADYLKLIDSVVKWSAPGVKIWLCFPIPIFSNTTSNSVIDTVLIPVIKEVATLKGLKTIDLNTGFKGHSDWCIADGIHPTDVGFQKIAQFIFDSIKVMVKTITVEAKGGAPATITTPGGKLQMEATVLPADATKNSVTWSIQNIDGKATINVLGEVTAKADGTVKVIATSIDGSGVKGELTLTLSNQPSAVSVQKTGITVWPNPAGELLYIEGAGNNSQISIFNIMGTTERVIPVTGSIRSLDVSALSPGIYFLRIVENGHYEVVRFVKE